MAVRRITLGSLFSGSGGFELAGCMHGIVPVFSSEIEPFPLRVEALRFPNCKQLGSVTDINGADVEPVNIITFGSPCQDLSVAGKQKGIHDGERSNLFFEAIRIIKEMRNATADKFPRFAVWENVPGAFSSNKGEDFRAVLQALCEIKGGCGVSVPMPRNNKWLPAGCVVGDGFSVAWRVYDAQYWGVPQRRKRIYLVADFGSERAGEILFKSESMRGNSAESGEAWQGTADDAQGSTGGSNQVRCLNPWDSQSIRQYSADGVWPNLNANSNGGQNRSGVCIPAAFMGGQGAKARSIAYCDDGSTPTIKSVPSGGNTVPDVVYPINTMIVTRCGKDDMRTCFGVGEPNDPQFTLSAAHEHGVCYCMEGNTVDRDAKQNGSGVSEDVSPSLNTQDRHAVAYYPIENHPLDSRCELNEPDDPCQTLSARMGTGGNNVPMILVLNDQGGR